MTSRVCTCEYPNLDLSDALSIVCRTCDKIAPNDLPGRDDRTRLQYRADRIRLGRRSKQLQQSGDRALPSAEIQGAMR